MANLKPAVDPATAPWVERHAAARAALPGSGIAWLDDLRARGLRRFAETGFPGARIEAWKYTDLRRLARVDFASAPENPTTPGRKAVAPLLLDDVPVAVFVDGRFTPGLSALGGLPAGVSLVTLATALADDPAALQPYLGRIAPPEEPGGLVALNTAFMADGAVLRLGKGATAGAVQVLHLATGGFAVYPRLLVVAGEDSAATLVENFAGLGATRGFTNAVTEIDVGPAARIRHVRIQQESASAWHVGLTRLHLARDSAYAGFVVSAGGRLARTEIRARLDGKGVDCALDGITLVRGRQHADITTDFEHASGYAQSRQTFKAVLDDRSRSVFQGRILVAPDAQRTDAHLVNRNLVLSRGAQADSKPELIIHADDVKCSHGATVGDLDRDALFYLRARGIDEVTARGLLIEAFVRELIDAVPDEAPRALVERTLADWLSGLGRAKEAA